MPNHTKYPYIIYHYIFINGGKPNYIIYYPLTPAASRGSASEEALLATRGEERKLDKHGRPQDVWHYGCLRQGPWTRADGRKKQGLKLVSRQFRKQRLAVWAAGRGPDPSFTAMVFEACDRVLGPGLPAAGPIRPSLPWCLRPATRSLDSSWRQEKARFEASF